MKTLLVIGGSGFFGRSILDSFQRGLLECWGITKIIIMARNPKKLHQECPELLSPNVELLQGDITTVDELPKADYVIHAAASTDISKYLFQSELERENIIMGVLNYCRLAPVYHKNSKIVFCSSGAVYGVQPPDVPALREGIDFGEIEGLSEEKKAYANAKRDSETAIIQLGKEHRLNVSIARCFAFIGRYLPKDQNFAIGNFIADVQANRPVKVRSNKLIYRSYMYADDLVEWLIILAHNSNESSPVYNVGSNEEVEIHTLAKKIGEKYGVGSCFSDIFDKGTDRYIPDIDKFNCDFGYYEQKKLMCSIQEVLGNEWF